eukprot:5017611-Amphidinium_carterae.1
MKTSPDTFKEQSLSETISAAATLKLDRTKIEPILAAVVERMKTSPGKFNDQSLSETIWAAATLKLDRAEIEPVVAAVVKRMKRRPRTFKEQHLSKTIWAAATLKLDKAKIEPIFSAVVLETSESFIRDPFGKLSDSEPRLFRSVPPNLRPYMNKTDIEAILAVVVERMKTSQGKFIEQELSNMLCKAATLQLDKTDVQAILAAEVERMKTSPDTFKEEQG